MNKLIIVGNGFDLHHDIKTDYKSFLKWYLRKVFKSIFESKSNIKDLMSLYITPHIPTTPPTEEEYNRLYDWIIHSDLRRPADLTFSGKIFTVKFQEVSSFFRWLLNDSRLNNWVDVEMTYYERLKRELERRAHSYANNRPVTTAHKSIERLNSDLDIIKGELKDYLILVSQNTTLEPKFLSFLSQPINISRINENRTIEGELVQISSGKRLINPGTITIVNFNYTSISDRLNLPSHINVINIHGSLTDSDNPMIFGYGDEIDEKYKEMENTNFNGFLSHVKSIGYFQTRNYSNLIRHMHHGKYIVYLWGHSCGLSDRTLLNMIFEHDNCLAITPFYWKRPDGTDNYTEIVQNISRHFRDKQKMRNRVSNKEFCWPL